MQTFGEQLTAARKAIGMTQESLAQAAHVTRQTISSWERGRTVPDIDTAQRLSDILGVDLIQAGEEQSVAPDIEAAPEVEEETAPAVEAATEVAGQTAPAAASRRQIKRWWIGAGAAVLACIVVACFLLFPRKSTPKIDTAYFTQETPNEVGKAFLTFSHRTWIENSGGTDYLRCMTSR